MKNRLIVDGEILAQVNDWFLSDDDSFQYYKKDPYDKKGGAYSFVQCIQLVNDKYSVVIDTVNIYDFVDVDDELAYEYLISIIGSYGYGIAIIRDEDMDDKEWSRILLDEFKFQNGKDWKRLLAECFFENMIFSADNVGSQLTQLEAEKVLLDYMKNN